jgi:hypothetical protein
LPGAAITAVGSTAFDGVAALNLFRLCVQGSVVSYTTITGPTAAGVTSSGSATTCPDTPSAAVSITAYNNPLLSPLLTGCPILSPLTFSPTPCTPISSSPPPIPTVPDPATTPAPVTNPKPVCLLGSGGKYIAAAFVPGLYTTATSSSSWSLSTPCGSGKNWVAPTIEWFSPGVYYFNFGSTTWTLPPTLVGGTPATVAGAGSLTPIAGLNPAVAGTLSALSQMPIGEGKCIPPTMQVQSGQSGVEFVFGGASTMTGMNPSGGQSTDLDICATYSATSPPVAIYGVNKSGLPVPAESGCVTSPICILGAKSLLNWPAPLNLPIANQTFHIDGYVWAPAAAMILYYLGSTGQAFNWGVLARTFQVYGASLPALTMASLPPTDPGPLLTYNYTVRYVNVWTCVASPIPCAVPPDASGPPPNVQVKLQQTATGWKVLSWSQRR